MSWFKYSFNILLIYGFSLSAYGNKFDSKTCLNDTFSTRIANEGKYFGLLKSELVVSKKECEVEVMFKEVLETTWKVDVCREPIHIKLTSKGTPSVHKRVNKCLGSKSTEFCEKWNELATTMQDYGLIYAEGEREKLKTAHGQVYCSFLLLGRYLEDGYVFSKYEEPLNIYGDFAKVKAEFERIQSLKKIEQMKALKPEPLVEKNEDSLMEEPSVDEPLIEDYTPSTESF